MLYARTVLQKHIQWSVILQHKWNHHPCCFPTASYIISYILQCGYQRDHITSVSNSITGFQLQLFILPTCPYQMYLVVSKLPKQSFTMFIPLPPWVNFHARILSLFNIPMNSIPKTIFFSIHLQIVEVFMGKWKCAFFEDL